MATGGSRFNDQDYVNWLRATLSLMYMKEGLEGFTDNQATLFHSTLITSSGSTPHLCINYCTSYNIKKDCHNKRWHMTCQPCDTWLQDAISFHNDTFPRLFPENTDPKLWQTDPWETMKLYIPYGCRKHQSARDADIQGILSLFSNCKHFSNSRHVGRHDLLTELIDIRNALLHSSNFKVNDKVIQGYFRTITVFLQGMKDLTSGERKEIKNAIENVQKLQANLIEISMNKELELRALQQRQIAIETEMRSQVNVIHKEQDNLSTEVKHHGKMLIELKAAQERFDEFLRQNALVDDMANLSKQITDIYQRVQPLEGQMTKADSHAAGVKDLETQCKGLQQHLLHIYGKQKFWKDPITSDEAFLSQMYVQPSVKCIKEIDEHGCLSAVKEFSRLTYKSLFTSETGKCENIYLNGEAGIGKTTFCNQLVLNWCSAVQNRSADLVPYEDHKVLLDFNFLFSIALRDIQTAYHIEDMIKEQLLGQTMQSRNISDILKTERCLIVLDGLDEWSSPDIVTKCPDINKHIPGRNTANKNCVFLTTTRHWKYDVISLENKDVDKYVELQGIDKHASEDLAKKMMNYLSRKSQTSKCLKDCYCEVHKKQLDAFLTVSVLFIQLITLWHFDKDLGNSKLHLYCSMLDLLFERFEQKLPEKTAKCSTVATPKNLPDCVGAKYYCQNYSELLNCLSKLAFKALFNKQKQHALVFESSRLDIFGISPSDIELCLQCGILSQSKDYGNFTGRFKKFSFLHKKVQEFLAALYIVCNGNAFEEVKESCYSLETTLEMNQVWMFVAGMDPAMTKRLMEHLAHVVSSDERIKENRQTTSSDYCCDYDHIIFGIQRFLCDCVLEGIRNNKQYYNICIEDVRIEHYTFHNVEPLLLRADMPKVKSVFIRPRGIDAAQLKIITDQLQQCQSLQKLYVYDRWGPILPISTVAAIVENNCDSLISLDLWTNIKSTDRLATAISSSISNSLIALRLVRLTLTHAHKEQILSNLSQSRTIRQLDLRVLDCTDCTDLGTLCRPRIDLSSMTHLQKFSAGQMTVDNLQFLSHGLEEVVLWDITLPETSMREFAYEISRTERHVTVKLDDVTFTGATDESRDLKTFLIHCHGLKLTWWYYSDKDNTWHIEFHTDSNV